MSQATTPAIIATPARGPITAPAIQAWLGLDSEVVAAGPSVSEADLGEPVAWVVSVLSVAEDVLESVIKT